MNTLLYILEPDGSIREEPDLLKWAEWMAAENFESHRRIALDQVGSYEVSTVFLGQDHNFSGKGPPILFETMTFGVPHGLVHRYHTKREALIGHAAILAEVQKAVAAN